MQAEGPGGAPGSVLAGTGISMSTQKLMAFLKSHDRAEARTESPVKQGLPKGSLSQSRTVVRRSFIYRGFRKGRKFM